MLTGVLILHGNKTYGKVKDKFLYKCISSGDKNQFLLPYKPEIGFQKIQHNKFVVFQKDKLVETIGDVTIPENYYEYMLQTKNLRNSVKCPPFDKNAVFESIKHKSNSIDRTDEFVFSIDPPTSLDFDDAFSVESLSPSLFKVSVHIANVYLWFDALQLWDKITTRLSTIYLPDRPRTMIPPILSNDLCSLKEGSHRFAFTMDM